MRVRVIADLMAARGDFAGEFGIGADMAADKEKSGAGVVSVEEREQARSDARIRAIVEGESDRTGIACEANRMTKELRLRMNPGPGCGARPGDNDGSGDNCGVHDFILPRARIKDG